MLTGQTILRSGVRIHSILITFFIVVLGAPADIPPTPTSMDFIHDYAGIVNQTELRSIRELQEQIFKDSETPIVVVTVATMREYDPGSPSIESFARRWFDSWGIGTQEKNDGILVLVSSGDRKARIELGADWGGRFDSFSRQLMDQKMVPEFKQGRYGTGLMAAVTSLGEIARAGPQADPPEPGLAARIQAHPATKFVTQHNPVKDSGGILLVVLMLVAGFGCLTAAFFLPDHRGTLVKMGLLLIAAAVVLPLLIGVMLLWGLARGGGSGGGFSIGGGGGGGFGGGSSGGGGASGSW